MSSNAADLRAEQIKETKKKFLENCRLPETLGFGVGEEAKEARTAMDAAFSDNVGMDAIFETLAGHAVDMGQFPYTSFVGYGVLQQIAQNGMIRNCIKTVADDITRSWITIKGGEETPPEKIAELQNAQETCVPFSIKLWRRLASWAAPSSLSRQRQAPRAAETLTCLCR